MKRLPVESVAKPHGLLKAALEAGPPSPEKPPAIPPAKFLFAPPASMIRIRFPSITYRLPPPSKAMPVGARFALTAGPPSPDDPEYPPIPAIVDMIPLGDTFRIRRFPL